MQFSARSGEREQAHVLTMLCLVTAGLWLGIVVWAQDTGIMPGTMGLGLAAFVVMWTLMMAAMMLPSAMPMISLFVGTLRNSRWARMIAFGSGYLLTWGLTSIPAFLLAWVAGEIATEHSGWTAAAAALIFASAGVYQLASLKHRCLRHCRSPLSHVMHYSAYRGRLRDLRAGAHHGLFCLGCCWGLMLLMIAFGVMNLLAMVLLAGVIGIEKQWRHGEGFARMAGAASLALALAVLFVPELAPGLDGSRIHALDSMGM